MEKEDNEIEITSLKEFMDKILEFEGANIIYRGQSNKDWPVKSSAYRRLEKEWGPPNPKELLEYNKNLIQGASRYPDESKETSHDICLLGKLQHYDAATSLIDFTKNSLVALWFACQRTTNDGKVFCLKLSINDNKYLEVSKDDEKEKIEKILSLEFREEDEIKNDNKNNVWKEYGEKFKARSTNYSFAKWNPAMTNNRILKQDSFFIFNEEGELNNELFAKIFIINKNEKQNIQNELEQISNFSEETIFPDFYGFAQNNSHNKPYGPQDAESYFKKGNRKQALGEYKEAIENYTKAIEINPKYTLYYNNRGMAYFRLKNYKEAIKDFNEAIELDPTSQITYKSRAAANSYLENYEAALEDLEKAKTLVGDKENIKITKELEELITLLKKLIDGDNS